MEGSSSVSESQRVGKVEKSGCGGAEKDKRKRLTESADVINDLPLIRSSHLQQSRRVNTVLSHSRSRSIDDDVAHTRVRAIVAISDNRGRLVRSSNDQRRSSRVRRVALRDNSLRLGGESDRVGEVDNRAFAKVDGCVRAAVRKQTVDLAVGVC